MDISISDQNLRHINRKIESGKYATPDDVLVKALALLDERDEELAEEFADIQANLEAAAEQSKNGQFAEYTNETLHELFEDVKRRGRERRAIHERKQSD